MLELLVWQDALEVMYASEWVSKSAFSDFTDVTGSPPEPNLSDDIL